MRPLGGERGSPPARAPHPGRAALLVIVAVAVTVALLTRLGAGSGARSVSASSPPSSGSSASSTTTSTTTTTTVPTKPPSAVELQVLNGLLAGTLSAQWSAKLHADPGYPTLPADNTTAQDPISAIYIVRAGYQPEAQALARTVGLPDSSIVDVVPPPSSAPIPSFDLKEADLVLVIGDSLASKA